MKVKSNSKKYLICLAFLYGLALIVPLIVNDVPLVVKSSDGLEFPFLHRNMYKQNQNVSWQINPLIERHANSVFPSKSYKRPLEDGYLLGSDDLGRDVFAGLLYGLRIALLISLISVLIGGVIASIIGGVSGYFASSGVLISRAEAVIYVIGVLIFIHISIVALHLYGPSLFLFAFWLATMLAFALFHNMMKKRFVGHRRLIKIPIDGIIMRSVEIIDSIPGLFILVALLGYMGNSNLLTISTVIGLLMVPYLVRLIRGEILAYAVQPFVQSAVILNFSGMSILFKQIVPNIIGPIAVALSFSAAGAILVESTLSFLGIGLSVETVSWGKMLSAARVHIDAWWLAIFPGLAIYFLIILYHKLGESISDGFQPKTISF